MYVTSTLISAAFIRSLVRTALYFMLIVFTSELNTVSAQNSTTVIFRARQQCPSGFHCFNNTARTVIIKWGHNGHICDGQEAQACYGETDPLGFVMGPRQIPQTVVQGDKVIFEPEFITLKLSNVTKHAYDNCIQSGQFIHNQTTASFEVPNEYLNSPGIKYFINYNYPLYRCNFGIKLELFVRSRQQPNCINHSNPQLGVCSGKGLCASSTDTFFTRNYKCLCMDAYNGTYCEELISCHSSRNPCKNGATCIEITDGIADTFNCICPLGYTGTYCEEDINDCVFNPCQNGGFCTDGVNSYTCLCQSGFNGKNCSDIIPNSCTPEPCKNGGTCERSGEKRRFYTCICPPNFTGQNCTVNMTMSASSLQLSSTVWSQTHVPHSTPLLHGENTSFISSRVLSTSTFMTQGVKSSSGISYAGAILSSQIVWSPRISEISSSQPTSVPTATHHLSTYTTLPQSSFSSLKTLMSSLEKVSSLIAASSVPPVISKSSLDVSSNALSSVSTMLPVPALTSTQPTSVYTAFAQFSFSSYRRLASSVDIFSSVIPTSFVLPVETKSSLHVSSNTSSSLSTTLPPISAVTNTLPISISTTFGQSSLSSYKGLVSSVDIVSSVIPASSVPPVVSISSPSSNTSMPVSMPMKTLMLTGSTSLLMSHVTSTVLAHSSFFSSLLMKHVTSVVRQTSSTSSRLLISPTAVTSVPFSGLFSSESPSSTALPALSTLFYSSTMALSPSRSSALLSSSVVPTLTPIPPLRNQTCSNNPCLNNGSCTNEPYIGYKFRCECPYPTVGPLCISIKEGANLHFPAFSRGSFLEHKSIAFNHEENIIVMTFKTNNTDGLLLFAADHKKRGDFIQLRVTGGKLEFRFSPGDISVLIQSNEFVNTGQTVTATARYVMNSKPPFGTLQVGNGVQLKREVEGKLKGIQLYGRWYIGGVPRGLSMPNETKNHAAPSPSFVGSIRDVQINEETISLTDANNWFNINEGDLPACQNQPCQNNGVCVPHEDNVHDYTCNCAAGFTGRNCESHIQCQSENCNGGKCIPKDSNSTDFVCLCPLGRVGVQCETNISITLPLFTIVQNFPSFLEYPVPKDAVKSFYVRFQFKLDNSSSSWNDSLFVYSAQNKFQGSGDDFFAVGLKNNKVLLQFNLGSGVARFYSDPLDTSIDWHLVVAGRDGRKGYLKVDSQSGIEGESPGQLVGLNLFEPLYIGGVPDTTQLPSVLDFKTGGFQGSIYDAAIRFSLQTPFIQLGTSKHEHGPDNDTWAVIRGRNVGNESYNECTSRNPPCANGGNCTREGATFVCSCPVNWAGLYCTRPRAPCYGYNSPCVSGVCRPNGSSFSCDCPLGKTGQLCDQDVTIQTPLFQSFSYMRFESTNSRRTTQVTISFKPSTLHGILFYFGYHDNSDTGDFISIYLYNGFVKLRYDVGNGVAVAKSNLTVALDTWYTVSVSRVEKNATLTVTGDTPVSIVSPGRAIALDVKSSFYLGGVPSLKDINPNATDSMVQNFLGCIRQLRVNGILYMQEHTSALEGRNIANCPGPQWA